VLKEKTLFEDVDKVATAIDRLQTFEPEEGYYLAFSGGKDSIVIKELANMAGVKYDVHYSNTTIDPPDLIYFIREHHSDVIWDQPKQPFLTRLVEKGFPQRQRRWCCAEYKENGGSGRKVITGIRAAESHARSKRKMVESCYKDTTKQYVNPIIDWTDAEVWEFIRARKMPYCKLYDEGWKRIGCLMCPMAGKHRKIEAERYPKFTQAFIRAFKLMYDKKKSEGKTSVDRWKDGEDMFWYWLLDVRDKGDPDQGVMFER